jgi:hypothetical protein
VTADIETSLARLIELAPIDVTVKGSVARLDWEPNDGTRYSLFIFETPRSAVEFAPVADYAADSVTVVVQHPKQAVWQMRSFAHVEPPAARQVVAASYIEDKLTREGGPTNGSMEWTANVVTIMLSSYLQRPIHINAEWLERFLGDNE